MSIQFIGIKDFKPEETEKITEISEHYHEKLKIKVPKFLLKIHTKKQKKAGNRQKFSSHIRIETPHIIAVSESHDWDLTRVLHECFKKLEKELNHKFKLEGHLPKPK
jgi:ribosome-associated translation inhibitor RaiA